MITGFVIVYISLRRISLNKRNASRSFVVIVEKSLAFNKLNIVFVSSVVEHGNTWGWMRYFTFFLSMSVIFGVFIVIIVVVVVVIVVVIVPSS